MNKKIIPLLLLGGVGAYFLLKKKPLDPPPCDPPFMIAKWSNTLDILADGAFDRTGPIQNLGWDASDYISVEKVNGDYILRAPGELGTHVFERVVVKDFSGMQSWGGTMYVNLKNIVHYPSIPDIVFTGAFRSSSDTYRDFVLAAFRQDGKSYIYSDGYHHDAWPRRIVPINQHKFIYIPDADYTDIQEPWPDRFIRIDWFFAIERSLYVRIDGGNWNEIVNKSDSPMFDFARLDVGWVSSFGGGNVLIKDVSLYQNCSDIYL